MKYFLFIFFLCSSLSGEEHNKPWIEWDSEEGFQRLQKCAANKNLWKLLRFYESQIRGTYCGIASSVMVLNALGVKAPPSKYLGPKCLFTQEEFFTAEISQLISLSEVEKRGLDLEEIASILRSFPLNVVEYKAKDFEGQDLRQILISALKNPNQCVLALYQRKELNQIGGGHWSPVAAYEEKSDSFLILDVARFKYPPIWVEAEAFLKSIQTSNIFDHSRGFIVVERLP